MMMYFLIKNDELLKKYKDIWNKVSNSIPKELNGEPIYNKKILKTKIRSYGDKTKNFHIRKIPKASANY